MMNDVHALNKNDEVAKIEFNSTTATDRVEQQQLLQQPRNTSLPLPNFLLQRIDDKQKKYDNVISNRRRHSTHQNHELIALNSKIISIEEENENINNSISHYIIKRRKLQDFCVKTGAQLCSAISSAPNFISTRIDICISTINMNASCFINPPYKGINVLSKNLDIRCNTTTLSCIVDAQGLSRHFYVSQSTIKFREIIFQNGNGQKDIPKQRDGGSLLLYKSTILFDMCQFKNNIGSDGGAVSSISSTMTFIGGSISNPTLFENNTASYAGGAIYAVGVNTTITATIGNFVFRNNSAGIVSVLYSCSFIL